MKLIPVSVLGLSMLVVPALSGCSGPGQGASDEVNTTEQAATGTTTFRLPCLASGNWNSAGVHTVGEYQIGHSVEHPAQQAAYFEFNLDPVKGKTLVGASLEIIGSTDFNIGVVDAARCPGDCFKVGIGPQGTEATAAIVSATSNHSTAIFLSGADTNRNADLGYAWVPDGLHKGFAFDAFHFEPARLQAELDKGGDWVFWARDVFDDGESNRHDGACPACPGGVENYIWGSTAFTTAITAIITVAN
jgi:hypothetical protein